MLVHNSPKQTLSFRVCERSRNNSIIDIIPRNLIWRISTIAFCVNGTFSVERTHLENAYIETIFYINLLYIRQLSLYWKLKGANAFSTIYSIETVYTHILYLSI